MTARQEREDHIRSFIVPKQRKFLFVVNGYEFERLEDAQWHAYCQAVRHQTQEVPRIYCRLARQANEVING